LNNQPRKHKKALPDSTSKGLQHNEVIMTTKFNILKSAFIAALISTGLVAAYAFQPAKTSIELEEPQVNIAAQQYEVQSVNCDDVCVATVKADDYSIYVEYALDDGAVEFLDILNVVHSDETVNAYVDRYEIEKINAAIAGVKP
jgi:hypothetical protein